MEHNETEHDLYSQIVREGWHYIFTEITSYGVNITFIKGATAPHPGLPTKVVFGKDAKSAYQKFLDELKTEAIVGS